MSVPNSSETKFRERILVRGVQSRVANLKGSNLSPMDRRKQRVDGLMTPMSGDSKQNEWNLLKEQFGVLVRDQNVGSGSIESYLMPIFIAASLN